MVRSITTFDEDFTDEDMSAALGWVEDEAALCPGCGSPFAETTPVERFQAYDAEVVTCHHCMVRDQAVRAHRNNNGDDAGLKVRSWERAPLRRPPD